MGFNKICLGEVIQTNTISYKKSDCWAFVNYLDTGNITENVVSEIQRIDLDKEPLPSRAKRKVQYNSIIYSTVRPNQRHYGIIKNIPQNFLVSTGFTVIDAIPEKIDADYLFYLLTQRDIIESLQAIAEQSVSTYPSISPSDIENLEVWLPELSEQKKIAAILSALDEKIAINREINDNLLAQAKAIKKQWVATNEDGYEMLPLAEVAAINPDTYSPKEAWEYVNYLETSSITDGFIVDVQHIVPSSEKLPSRARRKVAAGDVLFSTVRPNQNHFGIISDPLPNMLASTGFADIRSKSTLVCNELIYLCLTEGDFIEKMQQLAEQSTSTFPSIKPSDLGACQIPCPKDESSEVFTDTLKSLFSLIAANFRENNSLGAMRDALLPKLMSGEIDVSDVRI